MKTYRPVPISIAKHIAQTFAKSQVIIIAVEPAHECTHHTTYGVSAQDKLDSAALSERINEMMTGGLKLKTFEDYRTIPAAISKERIDKLEELVREARRLILAVGESDRVEIQFPQHGWLKTANELCPP